jgi:N-acetylmuramic acid 6-phosphate etherase
LRSRGKSAEAPGPAITEHPSSYKRLERMSVRNLLSNINREDRKVPDAVAAVIPALERLVTATVRKMKNGGRLFYIGAGTSGRIGVVDASEIPPTYGAEGMVVAIIAGGDAAIRKAVEFAEDDVRRGWEDLRKHGVSAKDVVLGIAASGSTPYVVGALEACAAHRIETACLTCNPGSRMSQIVDHAIEVAVGAEFITGSTRMKAGTAQKLVLNMVSTAAMVKLGRVRGNSMIDMQLTNAKLLERGTRMVMRELKASRTRAGELLRQHGSVRHAVEAAKRTVRAKPAQRRSPRGSAHT